MHGRRRIYLDNAATSFPKPDAVLEAMVRYATEVGASPGRGSYAESLEGGRLIHECRERICDLINGESPEQVIFTLNTTDALNLAIKGIVTKRRRAEPGRPIHLVTTALDHNSVLRPFNALKPDGIGWTCVPVDETTGIVDPRQIAGAITVDTALVAVVHASNVGGAIQPIGEVGRVCRAAGVPLLVDAAQSLGRLPVDVGRMNIDLLAFPGHKGLLGPLGTGGLYIRPEIEHLLDTVREGGTGSMSERDVQPESMPDRFECGSHNTIGIAGLSAGVGWLLEKGIDAVRAHERELIELVLGRAVEMPGFRLLGPTGAEQRTGVFSFVHDELSPEAIVGELESEFGVLVRGGLHCAPRAHGTFGTLNEGAVRLSVGVFTTADDVMYAMDALGRVGARESLGTRV